MFPYFGVANAAATTAYSSGEALSWYLANTAMTTSVGWTHTWPTGAYSEDTANPLSIQGKVIGLLLDMDAGTLTVRAPDGTTLRSFTGITGRVARSAWFDGVHPQKMDQRAMRRLVLRNVVESVQWSAAPVAKPPQASGVTQ